MGFWKKLFGLEEFKPSTPLDTSAKTAKVELPEVNLPLVATGPEKQVSIPATEVVQEAPKPVVQEAPAVAEESAKAQPKAAETPAAPKKKGPPKKKTTKK